MNDSFFIKDLKGLREGAGVLRSERLIPFVKELAQSFIESHDQNQADDGYGQVYVPDLNDDLALRRAIFQRNRSARIIRIAGDLVRFKSPPLSKLPRMPAGYGFKGGAARYALGVVISERSLCGSIRDFDLVRIAPDGDAMRTAARDGALAKRFMAEDFKNGHGVERVASLQAYFDSRDLTINEVLLFNGQLICSRRAIQHAIQGVIAPCQHLVGDSDEIAASLALKILRFRAQFKSDGREFQVNGFKLIAPPTIFTLRQALAKALSHSPQCADEFLRNCDEYGLVTESELKTLRKTIYGQQQARPRNQRVIRM
ncbi:MAG: hypothetical protein DCC75_09910 [Proteobacteria bacterium]|nr:MAG: hypothetical protein DCC75_09910 [Pseudomonadota bacterium]